MQLEKFPHVVLLNKSGLKLKELDEVVKSNIESFEKSYKTWQIKKDPSMLLSLKNRSALIARHIYDYFVEEDDQGAEDIEGMAGEIKEAKKNDTEGSPSAPPAPVPPPVPEKKLSSDEQALKNIFDRGLTEGITIALLRNEGFNTGFTSPIGYRGCKVGQYELIREDAGKFKLLKHGL